jgi:hypothetical protein
MNDLQFVRHVDVLIIGFTCQTKAIVPKHKAKGKVKLSGQHDMALI